MWDSKRVYFKNISQYWINFQVFYKTCKPFEGWATQNTFKLCLGNFTNFPLEIIKWIYSIVYIHVKLNYILFQFDDLFHQNESLCEIPFLVWISPSKSIGCSVGGSRREEIYWWITEIWTNVKLGENLTKQIFLWQTDYLWTENTQCNAVPCTTPPPPPLSTLFIVIFKL